MGDEGIWILRGDDHLHRFFQIHAYILHSAQVQEFDKFAAKELLGGQKLKRLVIHRSITKGGGVFKCSILQEALSIMEEYL